MATGVLYKLGGGASRGSRTCLSRWRKHDAANIQAVASVTLMPLPCPLSHLLGLLEPHPALNRARTLSLSTTTTTTTSASNGTTTKMHRIFYGCCECTHVEIYTTDVFRYVSRMTLERVALFIRYVFIISVKLFIFSSRQSSQSLDKLILINLYGWGTKFEMIKCRMTDIPEF